MITYIATLQLQKGMAINQMRLATYNVLGNSWTSLNFDDSVSSFKLYSYVYIGDVKVNTLHINTYQYTYDSYCIVSYKSTLYTYIHNYINTNDSYRMNYISLCISKRGKPHPYYFPEKALEKATIYKPYLITPVCCYNWTSTLVKVFTAFAWPNHFYMALI